jgi:hypothetical protein
MGELASATGAAPKYKFTPSGALEEIRTLGPRFVRGQTEKNSVRACVFRFALELGYSSMQSSPRTSK